MWNKMRNVHEMAINWEINVIFQQFSWLHSLKACNKLYSVKMAFTVEWTRNILLLLSILKNSKRKSLSWESFFVCLSSKYNFLWKCSPKERPFPFIFRCIIKYALGKAVNLAHSHLTASTLCTVFWYGFGSKAMVSVPPQT